MDERIARIETKLENMEELLREIRQDVKEQRENLAKVKTETRIIAGILSGGIVFLWEFIKSRMAGN